MSKNTELSPDPTTAVPLEPTLVTATALDMPTPAAHPIDAQALDLSLSGVGMNFPVAEIGAVKIGLGPNVDFDGAYARLRVSAPLGDKGWRAIAEYNQLIVGFKNDSGNKALLGVATPPMEQLGNLSVTVGYDPINKGPSVGIVTKF